MKLSLLAVCLCVGLLTWNAWLQIQVTRLSHLNSSTPSLKLSNLEIVDANGNTVVQMQGSKESTGITVIDPQGGRTVVMGGQILVAKKEAGTLAILDSNSLQLSSLANNAIVTEAVLKNDTDAGTLTLYSKPDPNPYLMATPTGVASVDSKAKKILWVADSNMATKSDFDNDAFIDVNSKAFSPAKSAEGTFLISCQGVEPYLEGYKVHLQVGNPTTLMVDNPKLTIEWGPADSGKDSYDAWKKALRQTTVTLNESLRPGFWNNVEVIVSPAKANELAHFKVSIETDSVSLTHPPDQH
jgi:hypothetical protein